MAKALSAIVTIISEECGSTGSSTTPIGSVPATRLVLLQCNDEILPDDNVAKLSRHFLRQEGGLDNLHCLVLQEPRFVWLMRKTHPQRVAGVNPKHTLAPNAPQPEVVFRVVGGTACRAADSKRECN